MVCLWLGLWAMVPEQVKAADEEPPRLEISFHKEIWREMPVVQVHAKDDRELKRLELHWQEANGAMGSCEVNLEGSEYSGQVTLPLEADGWPFTVRGVVYDTMGNRMGWEGLVYVDRHAPAGKISLESGLNQEYYGAGQRVLVQIAEEHMNASGVRGEIFRDGVLVGTITFNQEGNTWKAAISCEEEGEYLVRAEGCDLAGNIWQDEIAFVVDMTLPVVEMEGYEEFYLKGCSWTVTVSDRWLDGECLWAVLDTPSGEEILTWSGGTVSWTGGLDCQDGWYELQVVAIDRSGNRQEQTKRFCLHRQGSVFALEGSVLIEENQLPIVDETIWKFTKCGLEMLEKDKDYVIREEEGKRSYELLEEDGTGYQILTEDISGKRNMPSELLSPVRGEDANLKVDEKKKSWWEAAIPVAIFLIPFVSAVAIGRSRGGNGILPRRGAVSGEPATKKGR